MWCLGTDGVYLCRVGPAGQSTHVSCLRHARLPPNRGLTSLLRAPTKCTCSVTKLLCALGSLHVHCRSQARVQACQARAPARQRQEDNRPQTRPQASCCCCRCRPYRSSSRHHSSCSSRRSGGGGCEPCCGVACCGCACCAQDGDEAHTRQARASQAHDAGAQFGKVQPRLLQLRCMYVPGVECVCILD